MDYQAVFKRTEMKYILNKDQLSCIMDAADSEMTDDLYARSSVRSIYFDTSDFILARRSIEKPMYKEKLRLRSYRPAKSSDSVFLEIKKKYDGTVYKRRTDIRYSDAMEWVNRTEHPNNDSQIGNEISYFTRCYGPLFPQMMITYDRIALKGVSDPSFRMTFDSNVMARTNELDLGTYAIGRNIIDEDMTLMELKSTGGVPIWLTRVLSKNRIYPSHYSKYGTGYRELVLSNASSSQDAN